MKNGTVFGWGDNSMCEATGIVTTNPPNLSASRVQVGGKVLSNVVSIVAARGFSLALKMDGTVVTWGKNHVPGGLTNVTAIAAEWSTSWALRHDGTIVGWPSEPSAHNYGQILPVEGLSNVVAIAFGPGGYSWRGLALKQDGTVENWGGESIHKDATPSAGLSNVVAIAVGANHSLALKNDGSVVGWGFNTLGQATGSVTTNTPSVSAGQVTIDGQQLTNVVSIAAGTGYSLALKDDGTLVGWGRMLHRFPVNVPSGLSNVVAIAAGAQDNCLAITTNSDVAARFSPAK